MNFALSFRLPDFRALQRLLIPILIACALLTVPSCKTWPFGTLTPGQVYTDTALVITATRAVVELPPYGGPVPEAALNAFILLAHNQITALASQIQAGTAALWTPPQVQAWLLQQAAAYGSPTWMKNFIGNLVTEYTRVYNFISANSPQVVAYLNAFAMGVV